MTGKAYQDDNSIKDTLKNKWYNLENSKRKSIISTILSADRAAKLQEHRHLLYVGITRVKTNPPERSGYLAIK